MYRCEKCNTYLLERNKTKHNQTKKPKYYSNLILNQYVMKNVEVNKKLKTYLILTLPHTEENSIFSQ